MNPMSETPMTPPELKPMQSPVEWAKSQCNRYVNGQCSTLGCMKRGGYKRGEPVADYDMATCEAHETVKALTRAHPDLGKVDSLVAAIEGNLSGMAQ